MQHIHSKGFVYRDVKPENFVIGRQPEKRHVVHVVDFGLAKRYVDSETQQHIPYRERRHVTGTARFISVNMHEGKGGYELKSLQGHE
jgi:serine/threonine protein kinase